MDNAIDEPVAASTRRRRGAPRRYLEIWLPMLIVALDQATKAMVRARCRCTTA